MTDLVNTLDNGVLGYTQMNTGSFLQISSVQEVPDDIVWVKPDIITRMLEEIAPDANLIGKVPLLSIKEATDDSADGQFKASSKILGRFFHILDEKGKPTGKVVWFSIKGPKGVHNLKKAKPEELKKLKVVFDLGQFTQQKNVSYIDWFSGLISGGELIKLKQAAINKANKVGSGSGLAEVSDEIMG